MGTERSENFGGFVGNNRHQVTQSLKPTGISLYINVSVVPVTFTTDIHFRF